MIVGLTSYITKGHLARAVLEATGWQTREMVEAMNADSGLELTALRVDGGMTANNLLMQFVADVLGVPQLDQAARSSRVDLPIPVRPGWPGRRYDLPGTSDQLAAAGQLLVPAMKRPTLSGIRRTTRSWGSRLFRHVLAGEGPPLADAEPRDAVRAGARIVRPGLRPSW